jgi:drug/metabolite transporter (DMT)-like permease
MKALLLLLVSGILAAGVFVAGKQASHEQLPPLLILFWQLSGGALVVWVVSWPSRRFPVWDFEHIRYYLFGGLLGISIPYLLAFMVLQQLQVGLVGLLTALSPIVTYAMARVLGLEKGHPLRLLGLITGLAGVAMLVSPKASFGFASEWGYLVLALAIPVSLAASNIYRSRFWPAGSQAMPLVTGMLTVQGLCLLVVNLVFDNLQSAMPSQQGTLWMLGILALMSGASYLSSFNLLKVGGPVYLSQMGYVITAVTVLAGVMLWGEHYDHQDLVSMGLILGGLLLTTATDTFLRRSSLTAGKSLQESRQ